MTQRLPDFEASSTTDLLMRLPDELMNLIIQRLDLGDLLRFSFVSCASKSFSSSLLPPDLNPWLILPHGHYTEEEGTNYTGTLDLFNLSNHKIYKAKIPPYRRICGSSQGGWLIIVHGNGEIQLFHILSKSIKNLPPVTKVPCASTFRTHRTGSLVYKFDERHWHYTPQFIRNEFIVKAIISSRGTTNDIVIVIFKEHVAGLRPNVEGYVAFTRLGIDTTWRGIEEQDPVLVGKFEDIVFFQEKLYAVKRWGEVFFTEIGLDCSSPILTQFRATSHYTIFHDEWHTHYLVESLGELLLIRRKMRKSMTKGFHVMKLKGSKWVDVT